MGVSPKSIKVKAEDVAKACWRALKSKKIHHYVGQDAHMMRSLMWMLPPWAVKLMVSNTYYKKAIRDN